MGPDPDALHYTMAAPNGMVLATYQWAKRLSGSLENLSTTLESADGTSASLLESLDKLSGALRGFRDAVEELKDDTL